jgi:hypothetical protein
MFFAKLKVLGITIPTGFASYHDDGFVPSTSEHLKKLQKKYRDMISLEIGEFGGMAVNGRRLGNHLHIFYEDYGPEKERYTLRTRAHEEAHALDFFGFLDRLEKKMLEEQRVRIYFNELRDDGEDTLIDRQVRAELGAIYALVKYGVDLDSLKNLPDYHTFAREYYEKHRI